MLEAKGIHKTYRTANKQLHVLRGIDLKIEKGAFTALVGPSGAGKSTLLHILGGLDAPTEGKVLLEDLDIYKIEDRSLSGIRNKKIGFVFQFYHLLSEFTVIENVLLPAMIESNKTDIKNVRQKALDLLGLAGLKDRTAHFPNQLSGGEKQRAAIIRALINEPEILFCDEPTGNLDSQTGKEIISLISSISRQRNMTVVFVTHNIDLTKEADKVYNLKDGLLAG